MAVAWTFRTLATKTRRPLKIRGNARTLLHKMQPAFQEGFKYFMLDKDGQGYIKMSFKICGSSADVVRMTSSRGESGLPTKMSAALC